ncbi:MAG: hypothetical protein V3U03_06310 [Myxococcota bacterium]
MIARAWSLVAGFPIGALAAWALVGPGGAALALGGLGGGVALAAGVALLARAGGGGRARAAQLAAAASAGLVALPALAASALQLAPGPGWLLGASLGWLVLALWRAARPRGPAGGARRQLWAAGLALFGGAALVLLAAAAAVRGVADPPFGEARARAVFDRDASVATRPLPRCGPGPARVEVLLARGARPRLGPGSRSVWFDAEAGDGRRQVHRLERESGRVDCWTCGEPGNNLRPAPGERGGSVVFETDRHATPWDPTNTEIHLIGVRGDRPLASRRLTRWPGPDEHALLAPSPRNLVWSRRQGGGYAVVSAALRVAHGGLRLGRPGVLAAGGAQWTAPLDWSPDARSLVVARGNPFRPLALRGIDFASGRSADLGDGVAAAFNADGGFAVVASARRARLAGLAPRALGFLLAPFASALARGDVLYRGTEVRAGEPWARGAVLELGPVADWGEPTGISLSWDEAESASVAILGQRRRVGGVTEERLIELTLDCAAAPPD